MHTTGWKSSLAQQVMDKVAEHPLGTLTEDEVLNRSGKVARLHAAYLELGRKTGNLEVDNRRRIVQLEVLGELTKLIKV